MYDDVRRNKRISLLIVSSFVFFLLLLGFVINFLFGYGLVGFLVAIVFVSATSFYAYWKSDAVALRLSGAVPADPKEYARLHNLVEGLCIASGLPKPRIYIINDAGMNAFATGRNPDHAAVAFTTGLLAALNRSELEGVVAHELSHIKNYDILVGTLTVTMVGIVALVADFGIRMLWFGGRRNNSGGHPAVLVLALVFLILAPLTASLLHLAVGRRRESLADVSAVEMTRHPSGLIGALEKLKAGSTQLSRGNRATAHLWIGEPVRHRDDTKRASRWTHLMDTHPPLQARIDALKGVS